MTFKMTKLFEVKWEKKINQTKVPFRISRDLNETTVNHCSDHTNGEITASLLLQEGRVC